ncbi:endonuclease/exonuclease/phosphatase family protein [Pedobacter sp. FW305-3-2-15-E-R2A2]|uniref:endonuclease/exonuclease/phosphatase family protein n=1 Tax=Pedobacter sp. FW305-3-2-15-E-R2A2 TaxID=3140251 RepID=UPI00314096A7
MANAQRENVINIISYNIRLNVASDGENAWPKRKDNVKALVRFHDADILCVQEALPLQVDELLENTNYAMEGVGRDDGKRAGEFSAIYFDKSRFIRKDGGTFWLSETPEKPSKGWDAALNRVCSWVRLFDKKNKKEFLVFNTHYDHIGVQARIESAKLLKRKIQEIAPKLPVVFTGDLNVTPETEAIATIKSFLIDAKEASVEPAYGPVGTFNAFKFDSPLKDKIDYIFVNKGFKVQKFGVLSDSKDLRYPSDHLPIIARLSF